MLTDEQIIKLWDGHTVPAFGKTGINPIVFARTIEAKATEAHQQAIEAAVLAEREACAQICEQFKEGALAAQSGGPDVLSNVMLRQVAVLGHSACADAIRSRTQNMRIPDARKEDA